VWEVGICGWKSEAREQARTVYHPRDLRGVSEEGLDPEKVSRALILMIAAHRCSSRTAQSISMESIRVEATDMAKVDSSASSPGPRTDHQSQTRSPCPP